MADLVSFALAVASLFGFYALLALSLGIIFGQLGVVNVAHGEFVMVGAFTMYALDGVPFLLRLAVAVGIGLVLGVVTERLVLSRLYARGFLATLLAMWGVAIVLRQGADAIFGSTPASVPAPIEGTVHVLGVAYPAYRLVATAGCLVVVGVMLLVVYRTSFGLKVRATVDNREMASLLGIPPAVMMTGGFAIGTAIAVLAGAIQSPTLGVTPQIGAAMLAPAFFAVLIGRPGSLPGSILGAFVVALLSTLLRNNLTETVAQFVLFALLIALIALRPNGLTWRRPAWLTRSSTPATAPAGAR
ncbi:urea ABC transporter permease subunit UrtB [Blastococcus jejuensis]|uniref:Urea ABC transporter permease subunit UrtB n=1 Tax=Blastococcus jejuensis TaxID=351224 RepID=A0ABP6P099_9ACTN